MRHGKRIGVVIPALDEEQAIGAVIGEIPGYVDIVIVADNGSRDRTAELARAAGATVVSEPERGYGAACLAGIAAAGPVDIVVFLDGDHSDHPAQMDRLIDPIAEGRAGLVIGSRVLGRAEQGSLTPQQRFGNWLACRLMRLVWGVRYTDLGPFRAAGRQTLQRLGMRDRNYGWTVEMQINAAMLGIPSIEVPVDYRRRIGQSKVSGTVKGVVLAGTKILTVIALSAIRHAARRRQGRGS